jgi:hypothetical protein
VAERPANPLGFVLGAACHFLGRRWQYRLGLCHDGKLQRVHPLPVMSCLIRRNVRYCRYGRAVVPLVACAIVLNSRRFEVSVVVALLPKF